MTDQSNLERKREVVSHHILPTSANLLGICFLIFSMAHFTDKAEVTLIDDFSAVAILVFLVASLCSYISLRSSIHRWWERIADVTFLFGLVILAMAATFIAIKIIH